MLASLFLTVGQVDAGNDYVSDTAGKRWTDGGTSYETREEYQNVDLEYEEFSMLWELYEGSIALTQMALVWKEVSDQDNGTTARPNLQKKRT